MNTENIGKLSSIRDRDTNQVDDESELKKRGYFLGSTLGEGSYAKVKLAHSELMQKRVAIKIINKQKAKRDFVEKFLPRELSIIKKMHHPNIIEIFDIIHVGYKIYVIMELAGHGDLLQYIKLKGALDERRAKRMFSELTSGVSYLHHNNIVHRDLKCENLLLDINNSIKISDFGFARFYDGSELSKTYCGSAAYAAPEILQGNPYVCPLYDIWSMGVILYIMVCGSMPYDDSNIKKMIKDQMEKKVGFSRSKKLSAEVKELIYKLLESDISKRARISDIKTSKWLGNKSEYVEDEESTADSSTYIANDESEMSKKGPEKLVAEVKPDKRKDQKYVHQILNSRDMKTVD
ncbi:unnamed protein product [Gordionus sp. m RMFG-2023]|uniref:testis-specific serine/threonine-protein kinase 1-like n=1 Tax=Gordionus sp. m RMFG-2023 TaxID=3053472 RepID=UPI0030E5DAE4